MFIIRYMNIKQDSKDALPAPDGFVVISYYQIKVDIIGQRSLASSALRLLMNAID